MKKIVTIFTLLVLVSCGRSPTPKTEILVPKISEFSRNGIFDEANILSESQKQNLRELVNHIEKAIGPQVAVATIDTLNGESIEAYSLDRTRQLGLGRKDFYDGLLIVIAVKNRKMRIEIGSGLEKVIPDAIAGQIIREEMAPKFRKKKYYDGIYQAIVKIQGLMEEKKKVIGRQDKEVLKR